MLNDAGSTSGEVVTAVTMAGVPRRPPTLSAQAINHTAVQVNWTRPCKSQVNTRSVGVLLVWVWQSRFLFPLLLVSFSALQDLQGEVESYYLTVTSDKLSRVRSFPPETSAAVIGDLWPSTVYRVLLHASNGAHNTSAAAVNATTEDGGTPGMVVWGVRGQSAVRVKESRAILWFNDAIN